MRGPKGALGRPSSLVRRNQLKRKPRPVGQCRKCYAAGLSLSTTLPLCPACQQASQDQRR